MRSYVYIKSEANLWTVGFYDLAGKWQPESDHGSPQEAADRVHYLNGGSKELLQAARCAEADLRGFCLDNDIDIEGEHPAAKTVRELDYAIEQATKVQ